MTVTSSGSRLHDLIEDRLSRLPSAAQLSNGTGMAQSLGQGAVGVALLHLERALTGAGSWQTAHEWVRAATSEPVSASARSGLYAGAPAVAFLLHAADGRYERDADSLMRHLVALTHQRVDDALERIRHRRPAQFTEYDLISGLTGIGRLLLRARPDDDALGRILTYLATLAKPHRVDSRLRPGWWVHHDPDPTLPTPGGHANFGLAHGISGALALLALAYRTGIAVEDHRYAIESLCAYFRQQARHDRTDTWWPQWISDDGHLHDLPPRPSWCYGTPGIARSLQLAAIAIGDTALQSDAEHALANSLTDPAHLRQLTDPGLCHGWAGAYLTAWHAARDARTDLPRRTLPALAEQFVRTAATRAGKPVGAGLLEGTAGIALTAHRLLSDTSSATGWETCLLLT